MQQNSLKIQTPSTVHVLTTDLLEGRQKCVNQKKEKLILFEFYLQQDLNHS